MILGERAVDREGDRAGDAAKLAGSAEVPAGDPAGGPAGDDFGDGAGGAVTASDLTGTVRVRAADSGVPAAIGIDPSLVVPGGERSLAERVLAVCRMASAAALAQQRGSFAAAGIDDGLLERIGLPGRDELAAAEGAAATGAPEGGPHSWLSRA